MADQVRQDDDTKNAVAAGAEAAAQAATGATENFQKELSREMGNAARNGAAAAAEAGIGAKTIENAKQIQGVAEGISNAVKEGLKEGSKGTLKDLGNILGNGSKEEMAAEAIKKIGEIQKPWDSHDRIGDILGQFMKPDGVKQLATGDYLVREDGKESIFTPNGDRVTVNPDGTHVIKGDVRSVTSNKFGETTVTFGDGSKVSFDKEGILDVTRGKQSVSFARFHKFKDHDIKPLPWDKWEKIPHNEKFPDGVNYPRSGSGGGKGEGPSSMEHHESRPVKPNQMLPNVEIKKN